MSDINKIIHKLYSTRWSGDLSSSTIGDMRKQLKETLNAQIQGYWSGHTAYHIAVDGGFIIDSKRMDTENTGMAKPKKLTELGKMFMESMREEK